MRTNNICASQAQGSRTIRKHSLHSSRSLELNPKTADLLRAYLCKCTDEYPIPNAKRMRERWRRTRNRLAKKLNKPQLKAIH
ncbi:MAG: hypothetical protein JSV05_00470 [Candidatus Bathyarchaeota archaeon]|nr:MAG: hypothetical protein JSV05_00470 [Candidatus Bathyarchaeota archaeon]